MNKIPYGGELYEVVWSIKIPYTKYWIVWLSKVHVIFIVTKYFDSQGYYFNRSKLPNRPEYYI